MSTRQVSVAAAALQGASENAQFRKYKRGWTRRPNGPVSIRCRQGVLASAARAGTQDAPAHQSPASDCPALLLGSGRSHRPEEPPPRETGGPIGFGRSEPKKLPVAFGIYWRYESSQPR